ncbi:Oxidoreductase andH [Mycena venus]|uniref:Oxidoreductase andH n=1 Tax=Mycena venus TaxID=2733690 RepID=A0A8H7CN82_9AGAR|nr:Oxidoreductase andH [Mycena venus]
MPSLATVRTSNASYKPTYLPVAIFLGGTSGMGRGTADAFVRHTNGPAHIILVGRNAAAARSILASFLKPISSSLPWKHESVECDASLVRNAHETATALASRPNLPLVHFLVFTAGYFSLGGREDTKESRPQARAVLLLALGVHNGVAVLGAGRGPKVDLDNLGLKEGYTGQAGTDAGVTYTDLMIEELAARNPTIAFTHTHPGLVKTSLFDFPNVAVRLLVKPVLWLVAKSEADAREYHLHGLLNAKAGASRRDEHGEEMNKEPAYGRGESEASRRVWAQTEEVVRACTQM